MKASQTRIPVATDPTRALGQAALPRVLCVDDEPHVLEGIKLQLRRRYETLTAVSGEEGLARLKEDGPFVVVMSDMRMPGMNGAEFLSRVRETYPDSIRMLLTGHTELQAAIQAINQGQIFRFLTKPCSPEELRQAFDAAYQQYRLVTAERDLLEQTVLGCIKTLSELLSMASPLVFGRAMRIRQGVTALAKQLGAEASWALEAAAMLSQLGHLALPDELVAKIQAGSELDATEKASLARATATTYALLANIPRLEVVRELLTMALGSGDASAGTSLAGNLFREARLLRIAIDFEELESRGLQLKAAIDTMRGRGELYDAEALEVFASHRSQSAARQELRPVPLSALREGMVLDQEMRTKTGVLLVSRGFTVTAAFLERIRNYPAGHVKEPVRVLVSGMPSGAWEPRKG